MATVPINLVGSPTQRNYNAAASLTSGLDQRFIACQFVPVVNNQTGEKIVYVEKRPGLQAISFSAPSRSGHAISDFYSEGSSTAIVSRFLAAFGTGSPSRDAVYAKNITGGGSPLSLGDVTTDSIVKRINFGWFSSQTEPVALITIAASTTVGHKGGWYYDTATGTLAQIVAGGNDGPMGGIVENSGRAFYIGWASGRIFQSALNDPTSWGNSDWIAPNKYRGLGLGLERFGKYIAAFTSTGVSFFYTGQRPQGSILNEAQELSFGFEVPFGINGTTYLYPLVTDSLGDTIFWTNGDFSMGVWMMDIGGGRRKISGVVEDRILSNFPAYGSITSVPRINAFCAKGQKYLFCYNGNNQLLYHVDSGMWTEPNFSVAPIFNRNGYAISGTESNTDGDLYSFGALSFSTVFSATPTYQDDGAAYTMTIQTPSFYLNNGMGFTVTRVDLSADTQSSGSTTLKYSTDDGANWTTAGTFDMTLSKKSVFGSFFANQMMAFRLENSDNTPFRASQIIVTFTPAGT